LFNEKKKTVPNDGFRHGAGGCFCPRGGTKRRRVATRHGRSHSICRVSPRKKKWGAMKHYSRKRLDPRAYGRGLFLDY